MRKLCGVIVAWMLVALLPVGVASQMPTIHLDVERYELPNGLRVILAPDSTTVMAGLHLWYGVGSRDEPSGQMGFAHLFEHVMFGGSQHAPAGEYERLIRQGGGWSNGFTNHDATGYFVSVLANHLEQVLWLEADRMGFLISSLDSARFLADREVVKNERRGIVDAPYGRMHEIMLWAMYGASHPHGWFPAGYMPDLDAASLDDIRAFHRTWYGPANATLAIAGGFDPAVVRSQIARWFGDLTGPEAVRRVAVPSAPLRAERHLVYEENVAAPRLAVYWPSSALGTPDDAALATLAAVLAQTGYSRLTRVLVQERQLASRVTVSQSGWQHTGEFKLTAEPAPGQTLAAILAVVDSLMADVAAHGPTAEEVEMVRATLMTTWVAGLSAADERAYRLIQGSVQAEDPEHYATYLRRLHEMTPAQVRDAARRHLGSRRVVLSVVPTGKPELSAHPGTSARVRIAADGRGYDITEVP